MRRPLLDCLTARLRPLAREISNLVPKRFVVRDTSMRPALQPSDRLLVANWPRPRKGDVVVVLCTDSARRGDRSWSSPQVHVWTVRDGYAMTCRQYQGDQQTEDEFWSEPV